MLKLSCVKSIFLGNLVLLKILSSTLCNYNNVFFTFCLSLRLFKCNYPEYSRSCTLGFLFISC